MVAIFVAQGAAIAVGIHPDIDGGAIVQGGDALGTIDGGDAEAVEIGIEIEDVLTALSHYRRKC
jgi:hypothetical protein